MCEIRSFLYRTVGPATGVSPLNGINLDCPTVRRERIVKLS